MTAKSCTFKTNMLYLYYNKKTFYDSNRSGIK